MLKKLLLATAATAALSSGALAADLPVEVPAAIPAPIIFNWTGFYVGVNAGWIRQNGDAIVVGDPAFVGIGGPVLAGTAPGGFDTGSDGWLFGAQLGYNIQFGNIVAGIEADLQYTDIGGAAGFGPVAVAAGLGGGTRTTSAFTEMDWFGTLRGRVGVAFDRVMIYATGGLAWGNVEVGNTQTRTIGAVATFASGSVSDTQWGWTLGAGVEFAVVNNVSVKVEYLYYDLGDITVTSPAFAAGAVGSNPAMTTNHELNGHIIRAGVNFRF
jgi:outer membrane immunogenic protein